MRFSLSLIVLLLAALLPFQAGGAVDDDDDPRTPIQAKPQPFSPPTPALEPQAAGGLRLALEQQLSAGIAVQTLQASRQRLEFAAYARVLDIQPLLNLSMRQRALLAEQAVSRSASHMAQKSLERMALLHRQDAASLRSLQQAEAQYAGDAARSSAAEQQLAILRTEALQQWGPVLSGWALAAKSEALERLLSRQEVLVELALPPERSLPAATATVRLARQGDAAHALDGRLISPAPRTGETTQGETWFAVAPAASLRTGMRLDAWIADGPELAGVEFPVEAVLWRGGKPWVYVQTGDEYYARRPIPAYHDKGASWFVSNGLQPGERLVVRGAQLLLSEEFRGQIPDEDDD